MPEICFAQYRAWLGDRTIAGIASGGKIRGVIDRVGTAGSRAYFTLARHPGVFMIVDAATPDATLARPGDRVELTATLDAEGQYIVTEFKDESLKR